MVLIKQKETAKALSGGLHTNVITCVQIRVIQSEVNAEQGY